MRAWRRVFSLVGLMVGIWGGAAVPLVSASPPPPGVYLLLADHSGLVLEWVAPPVRVLSVDDGTVDVVAEGYAQTGQPGAPRLPFTSALIVLPPGAIPSLRFLPVEETTLPLPAPIAAAPRPEGVLRDREGHPIGGVLAPANAESRPSVRVPVVLEEIGIVRGVRLARLTFYPALPEGGALRVTHRLRVEVSWEVQGLSALTLSSTPDPLLRQVRQAVLNPWDAVPAARTSGQGLLRTDVGEVPTAFIEVANPGLYRVTYEDLEGLSLGPVAPRNLRLFRGNDEMAYEWEGDDDAILEPGEALLFYAEPRFSRWINADVYRLVADITPGLRMTRRSADPAGLPTGIPWVEQVAEENHVYTPDCFCGHLPPGRDGDRWVWEELRRPDRATASFPICTPAVDAGQPATLTLWLIGYTAVAADPDHRLDVALNGTPLGRVEWDGKAGATAILSIPAGVLQSGNNTLALTLPGIPGVGTEGAWLDAFAVRYARSAAVVGTSLRFEGGAGQQAYTVGLMDTSSLRTYDVTDPLHPQRLADVLMDGNTVTLGDPPGDAPSRYILAGADGIRRPTCVRAPEHLVPPQSSPRGGKRLGSAGGVAGADLLIITHPVFADALAPLLALRQSRGLTISVVNVLGIYDTYGDGRPAPEAIRAFIADAYATWDPHPAYILLVGDGSFDPRRYQPESPPTFIPPYLADVDPWAGETAADDRYACVDGEDALPDLLLGRLPVQTAEEARTVVDKIVRYEADPSPGGWNANVFLVADDADWAGDFAASSEAYATAYVTSPFTVTRRYCVGSAFHSSDCPAEETGALHAALLGDWNRGALLVQFTGHSSWQQWAAERFFHLDDLLALHNDRRQPVVVEMTCFTGAFQRPEPTLDENLVTLSGGGAVAAWGPTGLGVGPGHAHLSDGFFHAVFADGVGTIGEAALAGKLALVASGLNLDLLDTFILLGDPALRLDQTVVPWAHKVFLPVTLRGD